MVFPAAVLFDFDGVIVDSERLHHQTLVEAMEGEGPVVTWEFYREKLMGFDDRGAFAVLLEQAGIEPTPEEIQRRIHRKAQLFAKQAAEGHVPAFPGAVELIRACTVVCPVGLCSGARRSDIDPVLEALGVADCFTVRVTAEEVAFSKPDPTGYRLCVERLAKEFPARGIVPSACVAIEDTPDGIASALGAGISVLAVATNLPATVLRASGASSVVDTLNGLSPEVLASIVGLRR